jgi:hypothetical protein
MERRVVEVALRVLSDSTFPLSCWKSEDVALLQRNAQPEERDLPPEQLAFAMIRRFLDTAARA